MHASAHDTLRELIASRIGEQEFCIDIMNIREIRGWTPATPLPPFAGLCPRRGEPQNRCDRRGRDRRPHGRDVLHLGDGVWWDDDAATWCDGQGRGLRRLPSPDDLLRAQPGFVGIDPPAHLCTTRVVLASPHLNHDPGDDRPRNLAALCQRCHMIHDAAEHRRRRWLNAFRLRAIGDLFA